MRAGEGLETYLIDRLRADGYYLMAKNDPPVKVLRWLPNNRFRGCFLKEGPLDITGPMDGWHAELEAKDCKGMRWPLSKLRYHQYDRLKILLELKCIVGLGLRMRGASANDDFVYLIPAGEVIKLVEAGKKSILLKDLQALEADGLVIRHVYHRKGDMKAFKKLCVAAIG